MSDYYGWITNVEKQIMRNKESGTKTGDYFKFYFTTAGLNRNTDIRSKNLFTKDGKSYYVLSIGKGKSTWAPYPFIKELDKLCLILTQDTGDGKGSVWVLPIIEKYNQSEGKLKINGEEIIKQHRKNAGEYYSLSLAKVKKMREKMEKSDNPDYMFDLNNANSVSEIVKAILEQKWGGEW